MGDAAGIGSEIIAKALSLKEIYDICKPIVIGDAKVMEEGFKVAKVNLNLHRISEINECKFKHGTIDILDLMNIDIEKLIMGSPQAMAGKAAFEYIKKAIELALEKKIHAIATAPISKRALNMAGYNYPGHTEIFADLTKTKDYAMLLVYGPLKVIHTTTHVSLREACNMIKKDLVFSTIKLADKAMKEMGINEPRVVVAGLNPHAGEDGLFGKEELEEIKPAIELAKKQEIKVVGPLPPDTTFLRAYKGEFDIAVAMYHDQGHIAVKMIGFEEGVNVTVGLPIIRTSVDHGTAYKRAGLRLGTANPKSLIEAIKLAARMACVKFNLS
jgi:4-hydroxythreonine-4-phosphate dehydrogenase